MSDDDAPEFIEPLGQPRTWRQLAEAYDWRMGGCDARVAALEAENATLRAALVVYGCHVGNCYTDYNPPTDYICNCGLNDILGDEAALAWQEELEKQQRPDYSALAQVGTVASMEGKN